MNPHAVKNPHLLMRIQRPAGDGNRILSLDKAWTLARMEDAWRTAERATPSDAMQAAKALAAALFNERPVEAQTNLFKDANDR